MNEELMSVRKMINFDLDQAKLKEFYPGTSPNHAYTKIGIFLKKNGLEMMLNEYKFVDALMNHILKADKSFLFSYYIKMFSMVGSQSIKVEDTDCAEFRSACDGFKEMFEIGFSRDAIRQDEWGDKLMELFWFIEDEQLYVKFLKRKAAYLNKMVRTFAMAMSNERIVIAGAGYIGELTYALLKKSSSADILSFSDNNSKLWGEKKFNLDIISYEDAVNQYKDATFVVTSAFYKEDIVRRLTQLGLEKKNIRIINFDITPIQALSLI